MATDNPWVDVHYVIKSCRLMRAFSDPALLEHLTYETTHIFRVRETQLSAAIHIAQVARDPCQCPPIYSFRRKEINYTDPVYLNFQGQTIYNVRHQFGEQ